MVRRISIVLAFFTLALRVTAGNGEYAVSKIPASLLKNADAVLRLEELRFEVVSLKEAVEHYHYVITILNDNGDKWADFTDYYDKLREISSIQGYLYDAAGNQVKKLKSKDIEDVSGVEDISLI